MNRKPFFLRIPQVEIVYGKLTVGQLKLGHVEHYGDELTLTYTDAKYVVRHQGIAVKSSRNLASMRDFAAKYVPAAAPATEARFGTHGVAPRGAKDLREAGWRPL